MLGKIISYMTISPPVLKKFILSENTINLTLSAIANELNEIYS